MTTATAPYSSEQIAGLYDLFRGRDGAHGVHDVETGEMWTAKRSLTIHDLERHLNGSGPRVGAHLLAPDSTTTRVVVDVDAEMPGLAQRLARDLLAHELPAAIERSKSKGYHVWLFFERPISGVDAQRLARYLADRFTWVGEYFPRQDAVSETKPFGNFVFLPLYGRDVSEGRTAFLDVDTLTAVEDQVGHLLAFPKARPEALARLLTAFKVTTEPGRNGQGPPRGAAWVRELLQQAHIGAGERHPTFRALAGRLIQRHVPVEDVEGILALVNRVACDPPKPEPAVYDEIHELVAWVVAQEQSVRESTDDDPLATRVGSPGLPEFPGSAWRGPLANWKAATDGTTEAPAAIRYAAILAPIAARIGRRVSLHYGARLYPNVYVVGFGPTGSTRKTSAARGARRVIPESVRVVRGVGSGEALIEALQSSETADSIPALLEADELAVLLTRAKWDASSLPAILTEAYDCPNTLEVRLRKGTLLGREPYVCVLGFTTAEWFWRAMPEVHVVGGLGNRFLYLTGTPGPPIAFPPKPDEYQVTSFLAELAACDAHLALGRGELALSLADLSPDVRQLWEEFYTAWTITERGLPELLAAAVKRLPAYAWKLTLVYAYLERTLPTLTVAQLGAALEVIHYALASTRLLVDHRGAGTAQGRLEARVVKAIEARPLPAWKIHQRLSGDCALEDLARALKALAGARMVEVVTKTARGTDVWGLTGRKGRET